MLSRACPKIPSDKPQLAKHAVAPNQELLDLLQPILEDAVQTMCTADLKSFLQQLADLLSDLGYGHVKMFIHDRPAAPAAGVHVTVSLPADQQQAGTAEAGDHRYRFTCGVIVSGPITGGSSKAEGRPNKRPRQALYQPIWKLTASANLDEGQQLALPLFQPLMHPANMAGCKHTVTIKINSADPLSDADKQQALALLTSYVLNSVWPFLRHSERLDALDPDPRGPRLRFTPSEVIPQLLQALHVAPPLTISDPPGFPWIKGIYGPSWMNLLPQTAEEDSLSDSEQKSDGGSSPQHKATAAAGGEGGGFKCWPPKGAQSSKSGGLAAPVAGPAASAGSRRRDALAAAASAAAGGGGGTAAAAAGAPLPPGCASLCTWKLPSGSLLKQALKSEDVFPQGINSEGMGGLRVGVRSRGAGAPVQQVQLMSYVQRPDGSWLLKILPDAVPADAVLAPKQLSWSMLVRPCTGPTDWRVFWADRDSSAMQLLAVAVALWHVRGCTWASWANNQLQGVLTRMEEEGHVTPAGLAAAPLASGNTEGAQMQAGMKLGGGTAPAE
jgi:hypothetical protein